jgi:hypothetical protein
LRIALQGACSCPAKKALNAGNIKSQESAGVVFVPAAPAKRAGHEPRGVAKHPGFVSIDAAGEHSMRLAWSRRVLDEGRRSLFSSCARCWWRARAGGALGKVGSRYSWSTISMILDAALGIPMLGAEARRASPWQPLLAQSTG